MSFLYPRTIVITRPNGEPVAGDGGYAGLSKANEALVVSGVPASIQAAASGGQALGKVPSDTSGRVSPWKVFIPLSALPNGTVQIRDIVTDDLGQRYQVDAPYWDSMGYALRVGPLQN